MEGKNAMSDLENMFNGLVLENDQTDEEKLNQLRLQVNDEDETEESVYKNKYSSETVELFQKANAYLQESNWDEAAEMFEQVLDIDSKSAEATVGILLAKYQLKCEEDIIERDYRALRNQNNENLVVSEPAFTKALRMADSVYWKKLKEITQETAYRFVAYLIENENVLKKGKIIQLYLQQLEGYKDADELQRKFQEKYKLEEMLQKQIDDMIQKADEDNQKMQIEIRKIKQNWQGMIGWDTYLEEREKLLQQYEVGSKTFSPVLHLAVFFGMMALMMGVCGNHNIYEVVMEVENKCFFTFYQLSIVLLLYIAVIDFWAMKRYKKNPPVIIMLLIHMVIMKFNIDFLDFISVWAPGKFAIVAGIPCLLCLLLYLVKSKSNNASKIKDIIMKHNMEKDRKKMQFEDICKKFLQDNLIAGQKPDVPEEFLEVIKDIDEFETLDSEKIKSTQFGEKILLIMGVLAVCIYFFAWGRGYLISRVMNATEIFMVCVVIAAYLNFKE